MFQLESFIKEVNEQNLCVDAVMAMKDGTILGLHRFTDRIKNNVFSIAKSHTATAIGFAIEEGKLSLDDKPIDMFPELISDDMDPRWKDITLYHLLTMTSGHNQAYMMAAERKTLRGETEEKVSSDMMDEWLLYAFSRPIVYEAGERFRYGNLAPYVAGRMLEKAVGMSVCDYLYKKFWEPVGTEKPRWDTDLKGHTFGASDLYLDIVDLAKLGELYAGGGVYKGKRYLSEEWVKRAGTNQVITSQIQPMGNAADEEVGYGFYFWCNHGEENSFRCYGREGQFVMILPDKNGVIAVQASHSDSRSIIEMIRKHILPQL